MIVKNNDTTIFAAEVYPVKSGTDIDITKRGGRYQPEFIWNVNWQDKVDAEPFSTTWSTGILGLLLIE